MKEEHNVETHMKEEQNVIKHIKKEHNVINHMKMNKHIKEENNVKKLPTIFEIEEEEYSDLEAPTTEQYAWLWRQIDSVKSEEEWMAMHMDSENCNKCNYQTSSMIYLLQHQHSVHPNLTKVKLDCNLCEKVSDTEKEHKQHIKLNHSEAAIQIASEELRKCVICGRDLTNSEELNYHVMETHWNDGEEPAHKIPLIRGGGPKSDIKTMSFTTTYYPEKEENEEEKLGATIKGTSEDFKLAHAKIGLLLGRKGMQIIVDDITVKTIETPEEKGCFKSVLEISSNRIGTGKAVCKMWKPGQKAGTIQIT